MTDSVGGPSPPGFAARHSGRGPANRRWTGLSVLAVALLLVAVAPAVFRAPIAGSAAIGPIPGPPVVGDCLRQPIGPAEQAPDGDLTFPPVRTGPCTGHRFGEVVAVVASPKVAPPIVSPIDGSVADPNTTACDDDVARYLGMSSAAAAPQRTGVFWAVLPAAVHSLRIKPSALQQLFGQRWVACVEYLDPEDDEQNRPGDYLRTARGTFDSGSPPAAFSTCLSTLDATSVDIGDCYQAHPAELFALAFGSAAISRSKLMTTCTALVSRYTAMSDPTAGGRLAVEVVAGDTGKPVPDGVVDISSNGADCIVRPTADRVLTGPLMSLGAGPVPLG